MFRMLVLLAALLPACTGGPINNYPNDSGSTDTGSTDTGNASTDTADTSTTDTTDTALGPNPTADEGIFRDCDEAEASTVDLVPGTYSGTTDDWTASLDGTCVAGSGLGVDKMFRIEVPDNQVLSVDFAITGNDARIYLVQNCHTSSTCLDSVNETGLDSTEHLEWTNTSGGAATVYGVLDTRDPAEPGDAWTLTVSLDPYTPPVVLDIANTCSDFGSTTPIEASDSFDVAMDGFADTYDPYGTAACGSVYSDGGDGVVPVVVPDGTTLTATWSSPDCDAVVYLEQTCGDDSTCLAGADDSGSGAETISVQNTTGAEQTWALVLDDYDYACVPTTGSPGHLDVTLDPLVPVTTDTCTDAQAATAIPAGTYVTFGGATDDLDLADATASCTGHETPGDDLFLPVHVPAGKSLEARLSPTAGNAALYVVTACDDVDSCVAGSDSGDPEHISWGNDTGSDADVYLVLDSRYPHGDASAPVSAKLQLQVVDPIDEIALADTCAQLPNTPLLGDGTYTVAMDGYGADFDPSYTCGSVSGSGPEGFVQIHVPARGSVDVTYDASCETVTYLATTCCDVNTCLAGEDSYYSSTMSWTNDLGVGQDVVLWLDGYYSDCVPTFADPATLTVHITPPPSAGSDTCTDAGNLLPVGSGTYALDLSAATATLDPSDGDQCGGDVTSAGGAEQFVPIAVGRGQAIDVSVDPDQGNPVLYLVSDCGDVNTCLAGSETGAPITWYNDGDDTVIYAVVDTDASYGTPQEPQTAVLDVYAYTPVVPATAGDDCAQGTALGPLGNGSYSLDLSSFTNALDLADGSGTPCTDGLRTPGNDGFVEVDVPDGATLEATWDTSTSTSGSHNGSLYLLSACGDPDACLVGSDSGDPESISWTNDTGSNTTVYLVVDSYSTTGGPDAGVLDLWVSP